MKLRSLLKRNGFVLALLAAFVLVNGAIAWWNPMESSRRFYKNDFTKTLYHHDWKDSGPVFFGNSAVTGAYMEDRAEVPLTEMGLSYGKLTDLEQILTRSLYQVRDRLVIGIDIHTMLDTMETDPTYQWHQKFYQPYLYAYRDYFKASGAEAVKQFALSVYEGRPKDMFAYEPKWIDKELYFGQLPKEKMDVSWEKYEKLYNHASLSDFEENLAALDHILAYAKEHALPVQVIWMPYNPLYPKPPYMSALKERVNERLAAARVPVLDTMDRYDPSLFHDLVHLNREQGAPRFTKEVDAWLRSSAGSSSF
ncbi:hypothetical protein J31TS4_43010 [Paenibacillus sp. J31TS4]|uniref:hypothetical protein n=1 Tax=Paenibacillus sp. J31TS4 TaxID=2807195 RepID=UPI001B1C4E32|nr:hypothetical protein [Paenibacillus sp. J31TS4]GIP41021.1 hypothetical protein J31TS4_43010 [Paenibacillus sp. J31TS4]